MDAGGSISRYTFLYSHPIGQGREQVLYSTGGHHAAIAFLRVPGAPLDSNVVERALKRMIRQRHNSRFFASVYRAQGGSVLCSVIATALKAGVHGLDYLVALQRHRREVMAHPSRWLPWNYAAPS